MPSRAQPLRRWPAVSLAATLTLSALLVWLGIELYRRDQMLEKQYLERILLEKAGLPRLSLFYMR